MLNLVVLGGGGLLIAKVVELGSAGEPRFGLGWWLQDHGFLPLAAVNVMNVALYDFANYLIHRSQHRLEKIWPLHRVHHTDPYLDVTSAFRFHPFETFYRIAVQAGTVILLGMTSEQVGFYLLAASAALLFSHANIKLPRSVDRLLGLVIVTPDLHRIHHSVERKYHDSNYGIVLILWDRLLGTLSDPDRVPAPEIGLAEYPHADRMGVVNILADPLRPGHAHSKVSS